MKILPLIKLVLPKLVLQPLVENALYHGIKEKEGQGHIKLSVKKQDSGLVIRIEDDGIGFKMLLIVVKVNSNEEELVCKMLTDGSNFILETITR